MIREILAELGFPMDPHNLTLSLFFMRLTSEDEPDRFLVRSVPDMAVTGMAALSTGSSMTAEERATMEPGKEYGLHFTEEAPTTFTIDGEATEKIGVLHKLWSAVRTTVVPRLYEHLRQAHTWIMPDEKFEKQFLEQLEGEVLTGITRGVDLANIFAMRVICTDLHGSVPIDNKNVSEAGLSDQLGLDEKRPAIIMIMVGVNTDNVFGAVILEAHRQAGMRLMELHGRDTVKRAADQLRANLAKVDELLNPEG